MFILPSVTFLIRMQYPLFTYFLRDHDRDNDSGTTLAVASGFNHFNVKSPLVTIISFAFSHQTRYI